MVGLLVLVLMLITKGREVRSEVEEKGMERRENEGRRRKEKWVRG